MKILVGIACVAIVAFVGYFFWGEWQKQQVGQRREAARQELFELAKAGPTEKEKVIANCERVSGLLEAPGEMKGNVVLAGYVNNCRVFGYIK